MIDLESTKELLNRAFHLAGFILGDREAAVRVTTHALMKLEVAATAQGKRLYYRPVGRLSLGRAESDRFRNIVSFNDLHLLQRLIYLESEPYEIAQEQGKALTPASEQDLVIHFIKYLVSTTIRRNSFYVALGLSRLLYSYSTAETMDIYYGVIQDPERVKDDYYYRSRKAILMQELKVRFGNLIDSCRGSRGEEKFQVADNQTRFRDVVWQSLRLFTPWHTPCLIPAGVNPIRDGIASLAYKGHEEEDQTEVNRMHAVVHPDCFGRLTRELQFDAPETRLAIPRFSYGGDMNNEGRPDNRRLADLNDAELTSIKGELEANASRRKAVHAGVLRIMVDGVERTRIDLRRTRRARFTLENWAELIEVRARDKTGEELLLAAHFLAYADDENNAKRADASIILEGDQKISIIISPDAIEGKAIVDVSYREINSLRAARLFLTQLVQFESGVLSPKTWRDHPILIPIVGFFVIAICFGVAIKFWQKGNNLDTGQKQVATIQQNGQAPAEPAVATASNQQKTGIAKSSKPLPQQGVPVTKQREEAGLSSASEKSGNNSLRASSDVSTERVESEGNTRSMSAARAATPLSAVRKVYVETVGDGVAIKNLRDNLGKELSASNRITVARNRDEADALLKVTVKAAEAEKMVVVVKLINPRGDVIWPKTKSATNYDGAPADVAARIVTQLLTAIEAANPRQ